ncbi:aspartate--ammonia ligase [Paenibacillus pinihumi]|uniref:aspartate--ammonia ligase n=1 Tax=Paenibacillus pinihumi TaxID=669462 RepID=UPI0015687D7A|nr:aspartate--ammonia ligase [Paenibacillus pinihumi]
MNKYQATQAAVQFVCRTFESRLESELNLSKVVAPLFVESGTGVNDQLNGVERPVAFDLRGMPGAGAEIVHSLAKWKRAALGKYGFEPGTGLYADMRAVRRDEAVGPLHSYFVDQWDWEMAITAEQRTEAFLQSVVERLYAVIKSTGQVIRGEYPELAHDLPECIIFATTQELEERYPDLTPTEREHAIAKEHGAVFIMQIGGELKSGTPHDLRSPDYDDWQLNGDILVWSKVLGRSVELSSMGIRVDKTALMKQLEIKGCLERTAHSFHRMILEDTIPLSIGGGIGRSRICLFFLNKSHIGEVQPSVWPSEHIAECASRKIELL